MIINTIPAPFGQSPNVEIHYVSLIIGSNDWQVGSSGYYTSKPIYSIDLQKSDRILFYPENRDSEVGYDQELLLSNSIAINRSSMIVHTIGNNDDTDILPNEIGIYADFNLADGQGNLPSVIYLQVIIIRPLI